MAKSVRKRHETRGNSSIYEVAERANVSHVTVSRVFNNSDKVTKKTQRRVMQAADELGYQPSLLARALRGGRTQAVGLLCQMASGIVPGELSHFLSMQAACQDYSVFAVDHLGSYEIIMRTLRQYAQRRVDAVILQLPPNVYDCIDDILEQTAAFPAVVLLQDVDLVPSVDLVIHSNQKAMQAVAAQLALSGRRRVAFLLSDTPGNKVKIEQFRQACQDQNLFGGIIDLEIWRQNQQFLVRTAHSLNPHVMIVLDNYKSQFGFDYDALIASNDQIAMQVMNWAEAQHLRVSEDLAVIGRDNTPYAEVARPPLASIERHEKDLAEALWETIMNRLDNDQLEPQRRTVEMEFIWRPSAGQKKYGKEDGEKRG